jgi:hypothetical protein
MPTNNTPHVAGSSTAIATGATGVFAFQDDLLRLLSLILTAAGLAWSIWTQIRNSRGGRSGGAANLWLAACLLLPALGMVGCASRTLDAAGPYRGDALLWHADGVIIELASTYQVIIGLADRNPDVVANSAALQRLVAQIEGELDGTPRPQELLTQLISARDAYASRPIPDHAGALQGQLSTARAMLEHARTLLPALMPPAAAP